MLLCFRPVPEAQNKRIITCLLHMQHFDYNLSRNIENTVPLGRLNFIFDLSLKTAIVSDGRLIY